MKKKSEQDIINFINIKLDEINKEKKSNLKFIKFKFPFTDKDSLLKNKNLIILECQEHGIFECHFRSLNKTNILCPLCRSEYRKNMNKEKFLKKAKEIFGNFYNYDRVDYIDASTKICIICPIHGEFWQTPNSHLNKTGCPICGSNTKYFDIEKTIDLIKKECSIRIKNGISQTFVKYLGDWRFGATEIIINCPLHGDYVVTIRDFLENRSFGCQKCSLNNHSLDSQREQKFQSLKNDCDKIFGVNFYDFSKALYVNEDTKIEVVCKEHGSFFIKPKLLRKGSGCPLCSSKNMSIGERRILNFLKDNNIDFIPQYRVDLGFVCKKTSNVRIDFYIKYRTRSIWIEFNGEQHYMFCTKFYTNINEYKEQLKRDKMVSNYAKNNNIEFLEISYKDIKNIENILYEYLYNENNITKHIKPKNYG